MDQQRNNETGDEHEHPEQQRAHRSAGRSRMLMLGVLLTVALVIGAVVWTSERDGPGSAQFRNEPSAAYASGDADTSNSTSTQGTSATPEGDCIASATMPGGRNQYVSDAPMVENLGTGLIVSGTVREAGTCEPVRNVRIQIWLNTERGGEGQASNRGSVMTDDNGQYRLETSPVVPQFGQPHVHIAYDDGAYESLFLRSVMASKDVPTFTVDFVLAPNAD